MMNEMAILQQLLIQRAGESLISFEHLLAYRGPIFCLYSPVWLLSFFCEG